MKNFKIILMVFITTSLSSCKNVFEKYNSDFIDYKWDKDKIVEFEPKISDINSKYEISLSFRHLWGFGIENLELQIEIIAPSGEIFYDVYTVPIFNDKDYYGECLGSYCDITKIIQSDYVFKEIGQYKIKIKHQMSINPLNGVVEIGIIIKKKE
jgi:gliding motility-associated lipoprotein GldH